MPPTQAKSSSYAKQARDRHVRLPFDALQEMLARVAAARGSRQLYLEQRGQRQHYAELLPGGELRPVTGTVESRSGGSGQPGDDTEDIAATLARGWVHLAVACFAAAVLFAGRRYGRAAVQWPQPPHSS